MQLFADAVRDVFGVEGEGRNKNDGVPLVNVSATGNQRSDWTAAIWILLGVAVLYGAYIAINTKKTK